MIETNVLTAEVYKKLGVQLPLLTTPTIATSSKVSHSNDSIATPTPTKNTGNDHLSPKDRAHPEERPQPNVSDDDGGSEQPDMGDLVLSEPRQAIPKRRHNNTSPDPLDGESVGQEDVEARVSKKRRPEPESDIQPVTRENIVRRTEKENQVQSRTRKSTVTHQVHPRPPLAVHSSRRPPPPVSTTTPAHNQRPTLSQLERTIRAALGEEDHGGENNQDPIVLASATPTQEARVQVPTAPTLYATPDTSSPVIIVPETPMHKLYPNYPSQTPPGVLARSVKDFQSGYSPVSTVHYQGRVVYAHLNEKGKGRENEQNPSQESSASKDYAAAGGFLV